MADQKYTADPTASQVDLASAFFPVAVGGVDKKVSPAQLIGKKVNSNWSAFTPKSIMFINSSSNPDEDNSNLYWDYNLLLFSVGVNGDFSGVDTINVYKEIDAYLPQSLQGAIGSGSESGFTASTSRGTGASPVRVNATDLAGGFSGWGYTGVSASYQALAGVWVTAQGATANNLGGQLEFWTKSDNGALTQRMVIGNSGGATITTNGLNTTQVDGSGLWFKNTTLAANGAQQISPSTTWQTEGFATTPNQSQTVKYIVDVLGIQGTTNPGAQWRLRLSINGAAYSDILTFQSGGMVFTSGASVLQFTGQSINASIGTFNIQTSGATRLSVTNAGSTFTQGNLSAAFAPIITATAGAFLNGTANTELNDIVFDLTASKTWLDGTVALQRDFWIKGRTYNKTTTSLIVTDPYTFYVEAPTAGTSVTFTNGTWAIGGKGGIKFQDVAGAKNLLVISNIGAQISTISNGLQILANSGTVAGLSLTPSLAPTANSIWGNPGLEIGNVLSMTAGTGLIFLTAVNVLNTSGSVIGASFIGTFSPISGTGTYAHIALNPTVNQTGGANGAITYFDINPTRTSVVGIEYGILSRFGLSGFGLGATLPTATLDLVGSFAANSSFRLRSGTAPTSPNDGDMWYDGTNVKFCIGATTKTFTLT